jgi:hypothetical protein
MGDDSTPIGSRQEGSGDAKELLVIEMMHKEQVLVMELVLKVYLSTLR